MTSLKTNIAQAILVSFLTIFGLELASMGLLSQLESDINLTELPFDSEEEEEKSEKEKEFNERPDRPIISSSPTPFDTSNPFVFDKRYCCIPREVVTPPPELRS